METSTESSCALKNGGLMMPLATWNTSLTGKIGDNIFIRMHMSTWNEGRKEKNFMILKGKLQFHKIGTKILYVYR